MNHHRQTKLKVINELSSAGCAHGIMMGPMIPGLNEHEMQQHYESSGRQRRHIYHVYFHSFKCIKFYFVVV